MNRPSFKAALVQALGDFDGGEIGGTIEEADLVAQIGAISDEHVIELSDLEGADQSDAYAVLCDLLATRLSQGADQVLGCVIFQQDPDAAALAPALDGMQAEIFTPVLPLSRAQATALADMSGDIDEFVADATRLIAVAADQVGGETHASTLLDELAELVERRID